MSNNGPSATYCNYSRGFSQKEIKDDPFSVAQYHLSTSLTNFDLDFSIRCFTTCTHKPTHTHYLLHIHTDTLFLTHTNTHSDSMCCISQRFSSFGMYCYWDNGARPVYKKLLKSDERLLPNDTESNYSVFQHPFS